MKPKQKTTEHDPSLKELITAQRSLKVYIEGKEKEFKEAMASDKLALEFLEADLLDEMHKRGISSCKVAKEAGQPDYLSGTLYITTRLSSKVEDTEAFFNYVIATGETGLLFARAADKAVQEHIEHFKCPPPGVTVQETQKLGFRRSS
jgi:hypothetical protein